MLTADLVQTYTRKELLFVRELNAKSKQRALALAEQYLDLVASYEGRARDELEEALSSLPLQPWDRKLALGLQKLIRDRCEFEEAAKADPGQLRLEVFILASQTRRESEDEAGFDRTRILEEVGARHGLSATELDQILYADLKGAHKLIRFDYLSAPALIARYEVSQVQAVLLKAVRLTLTVRSSDPTAYRTLFYRLKFLRLMHVIQPADDGGYTIEIDGPYSLFESVTKYGLQLAMLVPVLEGLSHWRLEADLRWGKTKKKLRFEVERRGTGRPIETTTDERAHLPDETRALVDSFRSLESPWEVSTAADILDMPGFGLCVPDLVFMHRDSGEVIYLEVMGFWSRQAVWRRVELVEAGLPYKIIFAVSHRLRVSEVVLEEQDRACLYVYKGTISPRTILDRLEKLISDRDRVDRQIADHKRETRQAAEPEQSSALDQTN